jgi:Holliday junction resolvase RusA-like endonuclease
MRLNSYRRKPVRIEVPQLPPGVLSPNARVHWTKKNRERREYHDTVFYCCVDARNKGFMQGKAFPILKAKVSLTFVFNDRRRHDLDNLLNSFKTGIDAIVDSGLVLGDDSEHMEIGEVEILVDPSRAPLVVIEIKEVE